MRVTKVFAPKVVTDPLEALRRVVYDHHALEACAEQIGVSHQTLSKQFNPDEEAQLSLRRACAIEAFMDTDALAECFAARRGGVFYKLPALATSTDNPVMEQFSGTLKEFSEMVQAFSEGMANGSMCAAEVDRFEKEGHDVMRALLMTVAEMRAAVARCAVRK